MFFSIIIPTYNRENSVIRALESILAQTYQDFEVLVVDDGSTDQTEQAIKAIQDSRIHFFRTENFGVAHARNIGISNAKGTYVAFLDSDDLMESFHLQTAFDFIQTKKTPEILHLNFLWGFVDRSNAKKNRLPKHLPTDIFNGCSLHVNCVFIKNKIARLYLFNESRALMFAEDWDFFIKLAIRYPIYLLDKPSTYLIDHEDRNMRNFDEVKWVQKRDALILSLQQDELMRTNYEHKIPIVAAHMNSLIALNFSLLKNRKKALSYWSLALKQNFPEFFTRRTAAIFKHLLAF